MSRRFDPVARRYYNLQVRVCPSSPRLSVCCDSQDATPPESVLRVWLSVRLTARRR